MLCCLYPSNIFIVSLVSQTAATQAICIYFDLGLSHITREKTRRYCRVLQLFTRQIPQDQHILTLPDLPEMFVLFSHIQNTLLEGSNKE